MDKNVCTFLPHWLSLLLVQQVSSYLKLSCSFISSPEYINSNQHIVENFDYFCSQPSISKTFPETTKYNFYNLNCRAVAILPLMRPTLI